MLGIKSLLEKSVAPGSTGIQANFDELANRLDDVSNLLQQADRASNDSIEESPSISSPGPMIRVHCVDIAMAQEQYWV